MPVGKIEVMDEEGETEVLDTTLVDKARKFLQEDEITLKIVEEFVKLKFNPE